MAIPYTYLSAHHLRFLFLYRLLRSLHFFSFSFSFPYFQFRCFDSIHMYIAASLSSTAYYLIFRSPSSHYLFQLSYIPSSSPLFSLPLPTFLSTIFNSSSSHYLLPPCLSCHLPSSVVFPFIFITFSLLPYLPFYHLLFAFLFITFCLPALSCLPARPLLPLPLLLPHPTWSASSRPGVITLTPREPISHRNFA